MNQRPRQLIILVLLCLAVVVAPAFGKQQQSQQNPPSQDQAQQPAQEPPHVSSQPNPDARELEGTIKSALGQDPHMAFSRVSVHVTDTEVVLTGVVLTATAKDQAAQIATDHSGGRKVTNKIKVNPNLHPGPGL
jgi:osmotically-inducible protein OsmY